MDSKIFSLALNTEKYIKTSRLDINNTKYNFLLKLFDKAEIINQNID